MGMIVEEFAKQIKYIGLQTLHYMVIAIDFGIVVRHAHCFSTNIHCRNAGCTALRRIQRKAASVGETVQNMLTLGNFGHCLTIIFLVQEEARLLAIFHINSVFNAIFHNFRGHGAMIRQQRCGKPRLALLHTFQKANFYIIALEKATNVFAHLLQNFDEQIKEHFLAQLNAQGQGLGDD